MRMYFPLLACFLSFNFAALPNIEAFESSPSPSVITQSVPNKEPVSIDFLHEHETIQPGRSFWVAIKFDLEDGWHSYWKNPGDAGMPTMVDWNLPEGFIVDAIQWPVPQQFNQDSLIGYGYENDVLLLAEITPPKDLSIDQDVKITANISWLVCSDTTCLPGDHQIEKTLTVKAEEPQATRDATTHFASAREALPQKHEEISVERKNELLQIVLQNVESHEVSQAYFFPENNDLFDHKAEISLSKPQDNELVLAVKDKNGSNQTLKGILLLKSGQKTLKAIEIDSPIKGNHSDVNEVAMVESIDSPKVNALHSEATYNGGYAMALLLAFIGGMILNLMPCVLPVLSFKVLSFVKMSGQKRSLTFKHGLAFSWGVLASFWVLAGALLILQSYGRSVGWGFQLQEPLFVAILAALLFVFGLSLFGIMEIGTGITALAGKQKRSESLISSFLSGVLATAVATPCTGPFLGSAVGYAVTLSAPMALLIFTSIGLGMAFPYLLLSAYPSLLRFMPKPGNWMVAFKEIMGFFMIATVLWLVWVFGAETSNFAVFLLLVSFFFLSIGSWVYGKWGSPIKKKTTRYTSYVVVMLSLFAASYSLWTATKFTESSSNITSEIAETWEEFSPARVAELQSQGIPVFIDFTAKWCLSCQVNHAVLSTNDVSNTFQKMGVVRMKADWTKKDPMIAEELRKFGRNSVPLYVLYGNDANKEPKILPQVLTPDTVIEELHELKSN